MKEKENDIIITATPLSGNIIKLYYASGIIKILDIYDIFEDNTLSESYKYRWQAMYDSGNFNTVEVFMGDIVWQGWCQLLNDEIKKYSKPLNSSME